MRRESRVTKRESKVHGGKSTACGAALDASLASRLAPLTPSASRLAPRRALTLIELLVTIVILVTVLAGVIPVLSPNNDGRRVRNAARQLQAMITQAQALAAREGRPYGIAFRETQVEMDASASLPTRLNGGVGLEVFFISEPKPFTGFSEYSRVRVQPGNPAVMQFVTMPGPLPDYLPPNVLRRGDRLQIENRIYRVVDPDQDGDGTPETPDVFRDGDFYTNVTDRNTLLCMPVPGSAQVSLAPQGPKPYKFLRQAGNPALRPGNTSAPPLQFPRGVGIDMVASGADFQIPIPSGVEGFLQYNFLTLQSQNRAVQAGLDLNDPADRRWPSFEAPLTVGIMFKPSGRLHALWVNGEELNDQPWVQPERVYLLLGRLENSTRSLQELGIDPNNANPDGLVDFRQIAALDDDDAADEVALRREQLNWLNRDSLWVAIAGSTGRVVVSDNATATDPRIFAGVQTVHEQLARQIKAARSLARELAGGGGQ